MGPKKYNVRVFSWKYFYMWQLSHKHIVHNLEQFKESFIRHFRFLKKKSVSSRKLTKSYKIYLIPRNAFIKVSLNRDF